MSTNPLDLKISIPRLVEVSNIKQIDIQKHSIYAQQLSLAYNRKNDLKKNRTNETLETNKLYIKHNDNSYNKKRKEKNKKQQKNIGHIDIKI